MSSLVKRCGIVTAAVAVSIGLAEVGLWLFDIPADTEVFEIMGRDANCFRRDPDLLWRLRTDPDAPRLYRPNRVGLRGYWPARSEPARDRLRVVCVGDSSTFGVGVRVEDSYGVVLERQLQERLPDVGVEVLLAALPGHGTYQNSRLYDLEVRALAPDAVVLYLAGLNDARPATSLSDAEFAAAERAFYDAWWSGSRLVRALRHATVRQRARAALAARGSESVGGAAVARRVPRPEFIAHARTLASRAEADGALVVFVIPPLPVQTVARQPELVAYRDALRELVATLPAAIVVDGQAAFDRSEATIPPAARSRSGTYSPCFLDYVHPSLLGHQVLGEVLADVLVPRLMERRATRGAAGAQPAPKITAVLEQLSVGEKILRIVGTSLGTEPRVRWGRHWLRAVASGDRDLTVRMPPYLPTGVEAVVVATAAGTAFSEPVAIAHADLAVTVDAGTRRVTARIEGCPPAYIRVFFGLGLATSPRRTEYGTFALLADDPPGCVDVPVRWAELPLLALEGRSPGGGWVAEFAIEVPRHSATPVYAQALVVDPDEPFEGFLTAPVRVVFKP